LFKDNAFVYPLIISATLFLFSIFLFGLISWIIELHADINAIKALGLKNIKKMRKEVSRKKRKLSKIKRIIIGITHPSWSLTLKIYKKFFMKAIE